MLAQQVTVAHVGNVADTIPRDGLNSTGITVAASLSATLSPGTAYWYGLASRLNASTPSASHPRLMSK